MAWVGRLKQAVGGAAHIRAVCALCYVGPSARLTPRRRPLSLIEEARRGGNVWRPMNRCLGGLFTSMAVVSVWEAAYGVRQVDVSHVRYQG
jgi:hypothetical protein